VAANSRKLNVAAAVRAAAKGATAARIGEAAGSTAKKRSDRARAGRRIISALRRRGEIMEVLADAGMDLQKWAQNVAERSQAMKTVFFSYQGEVTEQIDVIDWATRAQACEQYMRATGMTSLPLEPAPPDDDLFTELTRGDDQALAELADIIAETVGRGRTG